MKKLFATFLAVIVGGACLCGNAVSAKETAYCDDGIMPLAATSERVYYENKTEDVFNMVLKHPDYTFNPYKSSCACIAGANVVGFYDRYDENLIPDHVAGRVFMGQYIYSIQDDAVCDLVEQLYADMGTDDSGTTVAQFKDGMITFCNRKGKSISFSSCMTNGKFDYAKAQTYMKANLPVALFCSGYNVADFDTLETYDLINYYESAANHVMVGFGYKEVNYTMSNGSVELYRYIAVASGTGDRPNGHYNINYNTNINDAYAINIY